MRAWSVSVQDFHIPLDRRTFLQWLSREWREQHEPGSPSFKSIADKIGHPPNGGCYLAGERRSFARDIEPGRLENEPPQDEKVLRPRTNDVQNLSRNNKVGLAVPNLAELEVDSTSSRLTTSGSRATSSGWCEAPSRRR